MSKQSPLVTIMIPCRNEEHFIGAVLDCILRQDYPREKLEVLVMDGQSSDGTLHIINEYAYKYNFISSLNNLEKTVPHALNMAIKRGKGDVFLRMDAHAIYPDNYISKLVDALFEMNADNAGGVWITEAGATTDEARAIALALSHPFGIGNARYRLGSDKPIFVDTVPYGCYRKEIFTKIGLFDEQLTRNQDDEFNGRLINNGGKIILLPDVKIRYFARENIIKLSKMYYQYGLFKPLVNIKLKKAATLRQFFPPALFLSLSIFLIGSFFCLYSLIAFCVLLIVYLLSDIFISIQVGSKQNLVFKLLCIFPAIHFSYGAGYLVGIFRFVILRQHKGTKKVTVPISR